MTTEQFKAIAISLNNKSPPNITIERAKLCESLGFQQVWIPYHIRNRGVWPVAGAIMQATETIKLGLGIIIPYLQDPLPMAMDAATVDELGQGRLILGIGSAMWIMNRFFGVQDKRPIRYMREVIQLLRAMFSGSPIPETQCFSYPLPPELEFTPIRKDLPIYVGAINKQMLALTGQVADGVKLGAITSPPYIRWCIEHLRKGVQKSNRTLDDITIGGNVMVSVDEDFDKARQVIREELGYYVARVEHVVLKDTAISDEDIQTVKLAFEKYGKKGAADAVTDQIIDELAVAGDPAHCIQRLKEYARSGLQELHAWNIDTNVDPDRTIRLIAKEILPVLAPE